MNNEEVKEKKNKKTGLWALFIIIIVAVGVFLGYKYYPKNNEPIVANYEILDESVISTDIMQRWIDENAQNKGFYTSSDSEYIYALISYGETTTPNIGICLENVEFKSDITVSYSMLQSNSEEQVEAYTPKMILRFKDKNVKVKGLEVNPS